MKFLLSTVFLSLMFFNTKLSYAQNHTVQIVFVRHSEKEAGKDPDLTQKGKNYAKSLVTFFSENKFDAAYSTPYKRTLQTIQPLAEKQELEIKNYAPLDSNFLKNEVQKWNKVLVVGHSNTIPNLINSFVPNANLKEIDESDYGKVFVVNYNKKEPQKSTYIILNTVEFLR